MPTRKKLRPIVPDWAKRIERLRKRLDYSQGELARALRCSAMTISRWERGLMPPAADHYIELGKIAGKDECWFFWERAGLHLADLARFMPGKRAAKLVSNSALAGPGILSGGAKHDDVVAIPLRKAVAGSHGHSGDRKLSLDHVPMSNTLATPAEWCPNPAYTSLLKVRGRSMEPLLCDGDIMAVDSYQNNLQELDGKIVVVANDDKGLCVSRFRRLEGLDILESESRNYDPVLLGKSGGWRVVGKVLWWVHSAP